MNMVHLETDYERKASGMGFSSTSPIRGRIACAVMLYCGKRIGIKWSKPDERNLLRAEISCLSKKDRRKIRLVQVAG